MIREDFQFTLDNAIKFEGEIVRRGLGIRNHSKKAYGTFRIDARIQLMASMVYALNIKSGIPGRTNQSTSNRLALISAFAQGANHIENLISEGQYFKAAASLKQDFEIITRIHAIKKGKDIEGKTPNLKNAPSGSQKLYGGLNNIAHMSMPALLESIISRYEDGEVVGVSPLPQFIEGLAIDLYELHLWTLLQICLEQIELFDEMYPYSKDELHAAVLLINNASENLVKAGFIVNDDREK